MGNTQPNTVLAAELHKEYLLFLFMPNAVVNSGYMCNCKQILGNIHNTCILCT